MLKKYVFYFGVLVSICPIDTRKSHGLRKAMGEAGWSLADVLAATSAKEVAWKDGGFVTALP